MLGSLDAGVSALQQYQQAMDVIGNNIANVDTTGFKSASSQFADSFSNTLSAAGTSGAMQVGTGVITSAITNNFAQGTINNTGVASELAINGNGFFTVQDAVSGTQYVTRDGTFTVDPSGYLVTTNGLRVQGYASFSATGAGVLGDVKISAAGAKSATATVSSYSINNQGQVNVVLSDGEQLVSGQVLLTSYQSPAQLVKAGNNLFTGMANAGVAIQSGAPGSQGLGNVVNSSLEMSNVDLAGQMASMITVQRAFDASSKIITTSDQMLQTLVNMKQ